MLKRPSQDRLVLSNLFQTDGYGIIHREHCAILAAKAIKVMTSTSQAHLSMIAWVDHVQGA
eukprot:11225176-Lingulodinium_polyedra.AAC.2